MFPNCPIYLPLDVRDILLVLGMIPDLMITSMSSFWVLLLIVICLKLKCIDNDIKLKFCIDGRKEVYCNNVYYWLNKLITLKPIKFFHLIRVRRNVRAYYYLMFKLPIQTG